jgi:antitoxin YefM
VTQVDFMYGKTYIVPMKTMSTTALRANLASVLDQVTDDHVPVLVTRNGGKPVVVVSLEDWNQMDETTYLLSTPANAIRLRESLAALDRGEGVERELIGE